MSWISCGHSGNFLKISVIVPSLPASCPEMSWISCGHYGNFLKISVIVPSPSRKRFPSWANAKLPYTVTRRNAEFHSTARMYLDLSLPRTESVSCFWTGSIHAQEWILPTIMENHIGESLHKQEFSIDYPSPRWSFPVIPPKNVFFHWCSFH